MSSHMIRGRQLSRDTEHRTAMRRNLVQSLFEHGEVRTTLPKAKECQGLAEKMITLARTVEGPTNAQGAPGAQVLNARRKVISMLRDRRLVDEEQEFTGQSVVQKLFTDIAPKFADRSGGYTRIVKTSEHRIGDGGDIVVLQLLTQENPPVGRARKSAGLRRKRNERRHQFAAKVLRKDKGHKEGDVAVAEATQPQTEGAPAAAPEQAPENKA